MDQGSNKNHSPAYNFTPTVTKFCVMWEGLSLPHDTKFGNCRCKIVDSRSFHSWSLIHGLRWSGLIKVGPGGKPRPVLVKFLNMTVIPSENESFGPKNIKTEWVKDESLKHFFINEDLIRLRANLARKAHSCRNDTHIQDTWTIYRKVMVKDIHGHIKSANIEQELKNIA